MSTVMPGLIVNKPPTTTMTTLLNSAAGDNGLQTNSSLGLAETGQFRKELSHLKVPFEDRYDSGIDSFKECDLQVLREEEECENNEQCASYNSTVTERLRNLNINEQSDISEEVCDDALSNECICDDVESCQCLTEDAFYQDDEGDTPLHSSIIYNSPKYAERFISCSPCLEYLNIQNKLRQTPMHLSVIMKQPRLTRQLVIAGANLEMQDHNGQTSLHLACKSKDYMECVKELTRPITDEDRYDWPGRFHCSSIPQNLELQNFEGYTCLHLAAFDGNFELLKYLVSLGANVNARDGKSGRTALHHAIEQGKSDLVRYLVHMLNADVDVLTFDHCTPLHLAVSRKFGEAIAVLMDANADRSITNSEGLKADQLHSYTSQFPN